MYLIALLQFLISVVVDQFCCTVAKCGAGLHGVEHRMIRMISETVLCDRVGPVVKIEDIIQSHLRWYHHVMHGGINSQTREVMEKKERSAKEIMGRVQKEGFGMIWFEKRGCVQSKEMARVN